MSRAKFIGKWVIGEIETRM